MIDLFKVFIPDDMDLNEVNKILYSGKLNTGYYVRQFEEQLRLYIGNPLLMVTSNNSYASLITLALLELKEGDEIIASPMACLASNMPILNFRAKLVWADIDPSTGTLEPQSVKKTITSKTKAILHYHWGGYPGYIDEINEVGREHGITVIDDAIEAFGSEYKGNKIGNVGTDITTFSFQTVRLPNSIDGGAIAFKSKELFEKSLRMRDFGINRTTFRDQYGEISPTSDITHLGYNAIMNELNAFIGSKVMEKTPSLITTQRVNASRWDSFCKVNNLKMLNYRSEILPNYWVYSFLSDNQMADFLKLRQLDFSVSKMHLRNDYYSCFGSFNKTLTGVSEFEKKQLSVPSGWWVNNISIENKL